MANIMKLAYERENTRGKVKKSASADNQTSYEIIVKESSLTSIAGIIYERDEVSAAYRALLESTDVVAKEQFFSECERLETAYNLYLERKKNDKTSASDPNHVVMPSDVREYIDRRKVCSVFRDADGNAVKPSDRIDGEKYDVEHWAILWTDKKDKVVKDEETGEETSERILLYEEVDEDGNTRYAYLFNRDDATWTELVSQWRSAEKMSAALKKKANKARAKMREEERARKEEEKKRAEELLEQTKKDAEEQRKKNDKLEDEIAQLRAMLAAMQK